MKRNHQKNNMVITVVLLSASIILGISGFAFADMIPLNLGEELTNEELSNVRAQTGVSLTTKGFSMEGQTRVLAWGDKDGSDAVGVRGKGWISMNNLSYKATADFGDSLNASVTTAEGPNGITEIKGMELTFNQADIFIEHFEAESITLGGAPGEGKSLGSLVIGDMGMKFSGSMKFAAH